MKSGGSTQHRGLLQKLVTGLKGHLLQRGAVGLNGESVQRLVHALEAHVVGHEREMARVHLDPCEERQRSDLRSSATGRVKVRFITVDGEHVFDLLLNDSQRHLDAVRVGHGMNLVGV